MDSKLDDKQWVIEYISNWIKKATRFKVEMIRLIPQNEACKNCGHGNKYHTPKVNSPLKGCHFCNTNMSQCPCDKFINHDKNVKGEEDER